MITPNMAVAICTIINLSITVINFILAVKLMHAQNELEAELKEDEENE